MKKERSVQEEQDHHPRERNKEGATNVVEKIL
jgi:hypothetical protein